MTQREYTLVDGTLSYIIKADLGYKFVRRSDGFDFGDEVWLGYRYENGNKTLEVPSDFDEVLDTEGVSVEQLESMIDDELNR
jgi:hypothetical protein